MLGDDISDILIDVFDVTGKFLAQQAIPVGANSNLIDADLLIKNVEPRFLPNGSLKKALYEESPADEVGSDLGAILMDAYNEKKKEWPKELSDQIERNYILGTIDRNWTKHIDTMARLREGIFLRSYANVNPLQDYVNEGYSLFREMLNLSSVDAVLNMLNVKVERKENTAENKEEAVENKPTEDKAE